MKCHASKNILILELSEAAVRLSETHSSVREEKHVFNSPKTVFLFRYLRYMITMLKSKHTILLLSLVFWISALTSNAQTPKQKAYREYKSRSSSSVTNVGQLIEEAQTIKINQPSKALDKLQEALALSIADGNSEYQAQCYVLIGDINMQIEEWSLAKENYLKVYPLSKPNKITFSSKRMPSAINSANIVMGIGNACLQLQRYDEAIKYFQEGADITSGKSKAEFQLKKAEALYRKGDITESKKENDDIMVGQASDNSLETQIQNQRAKISTRSNPSANTTNIYEQPLNTIKRGENLEPQVNQSLQDTKEEIAKDLRGQNRFDDEIELRNKSIEYNRASNNLVEVTKDKIAISESLTASGHEADALKELVEATEIAVRLNDASAQSIAYKSLAEAYEKSGNNLKALSAYKNFTESIQRAIKQEQSKFQLRDTLLQKQQTIDALASFISMGKQEDELQEATVFRQQLVIYGLVLLSLVVGGTSVITYRNAKAKQVANQMLALKSLRSQMNPHFIFNALNSVNHFIAQQDERTANKFLSEFSLLMRLVLDNSEQDFITLATEQEMLALYIKLEHYRFRDKFDYEFLVAPSINLENIELPPMLIQPYIENAVWHGLRYKETKGMLNVRITKTLNEIEVIIQDNGIGRKKSTELKTVNQKKHKSTGLKNIGARLIILNRVYKTNYRVEVDDLPEGGTVAKIYLPIRQTS